MSRAGRETLLPATRFTSAVVARSAVWRVIEIAGGEGLTFVFTLVMARLLGPADFGLVAIATVTITLALLLVRYGLAEAVIQHPALTDRHVHTALWANLGLGLVATLLVVAAALPLAMVAGKPDLAPILLTLAPLGLVHAVTYLCVGLLRRRLDYRGLALRALLATLFSYLLGIGLAFAGFGPWALVGVQLANGLVSALTVLVASGYRPRAQAGRAEARELAVVAIPVVGQVLPNAAASAGVLSLGLFLPASAVGLFYLAERLVQSLLMLTGGSVADLSLPVLARLQGAREAQVAAARQAVRLAGLVCLPSFVGVALVAEPLVLVLLGEGWRSAVPALRILALGGVAVGLAAVAGQVLIAAGHPRSALFANTLTLVPAAAATATVAPFGLLPALLARVVVQLGCLVTVLRLLGRRLGTGTAVLLGDLVPCVAATGAMALAVLVLAQLLGGGPPPLARLVFEVAAGALGFVLALRLLDRTLCAGLWTMLQSALGRTRPAATDPATTGPVATGEAPADR